MAVAGASWRISQIFYLFSRGIVTLVGMVFLLLPMQSFAVIPPTATDFLLLGGFLLTAIGATGGVLQLIQRKTSFRIWHGLGFAGSVLAFGTLLLESVARMRGATALLFTVFLTAELMWMLYAIFSKRLPERAQVQVPPSVVPVPQGEGSRLDLALFRQLGQALSANNPSMEAALDEMIAEPRTYFERNETRYEARGLSAADKFSKVFWVGMVDELLELGCAIELDYKEDAATFFAAARGLAARVGIALGEGEELPQGNPQALLKELGHRLSGQGLSLVTLELDSDSYVLATLSPAQKLAAEPPMRALAEALGELPYLIFWDDPTQPAPEAGIAAKDTQLTAVLEDFREATARPCVELDPTARINRRV